MAVLMARMSNNAASKPEPLLVMLLAKSHRETIDFLFARRIFSRRFPYG